MVNMNLNWVIEHKNGDVTSKHDGKGNLHPYHLRDGFSSVPNKTLKTIGLTDTAGHPVLIVDIPKGAYAFQRHRGGRHGINYFNRFHTVTRWTDKEGKVIAIKIDEQQVTEPEITWTFNPDTRQNEPNLYKHVQVIPEWTYTEYWMVGWRKREADNSVTVFFKVLYPDGKIDEHHSFTEKPWLEEPEWFPEEQV
jgi:hypothetical protein